MPRSVANAVVRALDTIDQIRDLEAEECAKIAEDFRGLDFEGIAASAVREVAEAIRDRISERAKD